jgi:hypothetical protein
MLTLHTSARSRGVAVMLLVAQAVGHHMGSRDNFANFLEFLSGNTS